MLIGQSVVVGYVALLCERMLSRRVSDRKTVCVRIKMQSYVFSLFFLNVFYTLGSSLYFHIGETEKKCFIEEIPDETMIIGERIKANAASR